MDSRRQASRDRSAARSLLAGALLIAAAPAGAAVGLREIGFGPVQRSMAGASVGAPLDAATVVSNPAGLAALGRRVDGGATLTRSEADFETAGSSQPSEAVGTLAPALGVVLPLSDRFVVGLGAYGVSRLASHHVPGFFYGLDAETSYRDLRVSPAVSWRLDGRFAVGVALNLARASFGYTAPGVATDSSQLPRDPSVALGLGATLGLLWRPTAPLTVGLSLESPTWYRDFRWELPPHPIDPFGPLVGGTERLTLDQPATAAIGASWRVPGVLVAADVQWIGWSSMQGAYASDPALTGGLPWDLRWSDQLVLKVGAQWEASPSLRLRAGYAWGRSPLDEERAPVNIALPAVAEHHVTLGAGWTVGRATVSVAGLWSPPASLEGSDPDDGISRYEVTGSHFAVDLGVGWEL